MPKLDDRLPAPSVMIFDWHRTLVDTHDAMFSAMEEMLPQLEDLGLVERLLPEDKCRSTDWFQREFPYCVLHSSAPAPTGAFLVRPAWAYSWRKVLP